MQRTAITHSRWRPRVLTLLLIPPACLGAYYAGVRLAEGASHVREPEVPPATPTEDEDCGGLFIAPAVLNLGEIWETPEYAVSLPVQNRSDHPLTVRGFSTSCDCSSIEPRTFTIAPGATQHIQARIDLTHRHPYQAGMERRELSVDFAPQLANAPAPARRWALTGVIRSRVTLSSDVLHFEDMCTRGEPTTRKVRAVAHLPLSSLEARAVPAIGQVLVRPAPAKPGEYDLEVTPDPKSPPGPFRFRVEVTAVTPDGGRHRCGWLAADGEMLPPSRVVPEQILLGEHMVGGAAKAEVIVRLPRGDGWAVQQVDAEAPDTTVRARAPEDGHPRYEVTQTITAAGDHTRKVHFVVRGPDGKTSRSTAVIRFHGVGMPAKG